MLVQLVRAVQLLGSSGILVSIYESGSDDATPDWLQLLGSVLRALSVRHIITTDGTFTRAPGQDRIAFLASVRQAALDQVLTACGGVAEGFCNSSRIVFINDVFFDATAVVRLLQYGTEDMACGMDFEPILADHPVAQQRSFMAQHLHSVWHVPTPVAQRLPALPLAFRLWKKAYRRSASLLRLLPLSFYDIWVARDIGGGRFYRPSPYTRHEPTAARIRTGLPFAAYCCWNGLVSLRAAPLLGRRVAFRAHRGGECAASECSLLCEDLRGLGLTRVAIDPGVRVAYRAAAAERLFHGGSHDGASGGGRGGDGGGGQEQQARQGAAATGRVEDLAPALEGVGYAEWSIELLGSLEAWRAAQGQPRTVECCGLAPGRDGVDFAHDCARVPVRAPAPDGSASGRAGERGSST